MRAVLLALALVLLAAAPDAIAPGPLMVTMGLLSLVFAAFMLYRRRDIKRMFAYSSIEHMGIIVFAFGMGGPIGRLETALRKERSEYVREEILHALTMARRTCGILETRTKEGTTDGKSGR